MIRLISFPDRVSHAVAGYVGIFLVVIMAAALLFARQNAPSETPTEGGDRSLTERMAFFRKEASRYDLVFIGDSRTYCGIHPEVLDRRLGTRSLNLAAFSNWFPTQYPLVKDLVRALPEPGTTVVWSIGDQNFRPYNRIQRVYKIDPVTALRYVLWGVPTEGLWDSVSYFTHGLQALALRGETRDRYFAWLRNPLKAATAPPQPAPAPVLSEEQRQQVQSARAHLAALAPAALVTETWDEGHLVSLTAFMRSGGYYRIEIDPAYFRRKQKEMNYKPISDDAARAMPIRVPVPGLMRLFEETLATFREAGIHLVVNELEEAPFAYKNPILREKWRAFMRDTVRPKVEAYGFAYIRADFDQLGDSDYFDYNHLNHIGIDKYANLLSEKLAPHLAKKAP